MQIDFHHAVTYIAARGAGFDHEEAGIIAYCAQYVDDATNDGLIYFDNGAMYQRIASAHKMLDYRNFSELRNHLAWLPFHFLPGNDGRAAQDPPPGSFVERLICRANSPVAQDMVERCIQARDDRLGLYRLGITLHVFADTYAHEGFAGVDNKINDIRMLDDQDRPDDTFLGRLKDFFGDVFDTAMGEFVGDVLPLGHGAALSYPDRPYLRWSYRNYKGERIDRDNASIFLGAADEICRIARRYRLGDPRADVPGLPERDSALVKALLRNLTDDDSNKRHAKWLDAIGKGEFSFGKAQSNYVAKGNGSWKHAALGTMKQTDDPEETFAYTSDFLESHWKKFHDALQAHRLEVVHEILPRYGICAA